MSERYYVTGVQLGMLTALIDHDSRQAKELLKTIEEEQFVGNVYAIVDQAIKLEETYIERGLNAKNLDAKTKSFREGMKAEIETLKARIEGLRRKTE